MVFLKKDADVFPETSPCFRKNISIFFRADFQGFRLIESVYIFIGIIYEKETVFFVRFLIFVKEGKTFRILLMLS